MADLLLLHRLHQHNRQRRHRERVFRERPNSLLMYSDPELIARYRFPRAGIEDIIDMIKDDVEPQTLRSHAIDATTKILPTERVRLRYTTLLMSLGKMTPVTTKTANCINLNHAVFNDLYKPVTTYLIESTEKGWLDGRDSVWFLPNGIPLRRTPSLLDTSRGSAKPIKDVDLR